MTTLRASADRDLSSVPCSLPEPEGDCTVRTRYCKCLSACEVYGTNAIGHKCFPLLPASPCGARAIQYDPRRLAGFPRRRNGVTTRGRTVCCVRTTEGSRDISHTASAICGAASRFPHARFEGVLATARGGLAVWALLSASLWELPRSRLGPDPPPEGPVVRPMVTCRVVVAIRAAKGALAAPART